MTLTTQTSDLQLATLDARGKPPETRLSSAAEAQNIFWQLYEASKPRLTKASVIQGMFDGNAPYNPNKLRNSNQAWRANFNTLEGAARKDAAKTPYYDLFSSPNTYAECGTRVSSANADASEATRVRSEEFDLMLRTWSSFDINIWTMLDDFIAFGRGFFYFPKPDSWHFRHLPWHKILFPDGTQIDPELWEIFAIEHSWTVSELYSFVKDTDRARRNGWNPEQVFRAIRQAVPKTIQANYDDPMALQQSLKNNELYTSIMSSTVQAASIYVREFDGRWSRMMVQTDGDGRGKRESTATRPMSPVEAANYQQGKPDAGKLSGDGWLFHKVGVASSIYQLLIPFIFEAGDGSVNALEGLGKRICPVIQVKDRMRCAQADNVFLSSTILLQAQTGAGQAKAGMVQFQGGTTVIPPNFAVQPATMLGDIERTLAVNADLDRMLDSNTGIYRPQFEKPTGNPESATAANIRFSQATVLTNSAVNRFYIQLDRFYQELYRRAADLSLPDLADPGIQSAREFQKACRDRGLSDKQITDLRPGLVHAMRAIGNGSPMMRQQQAQAILTLAPFYGPRGLEKMKELYVSAWLGQQGVEQLLPTEDAAQIATQDDWQANIENDSMTNGNQPTLAPWQNSEIHARTHLQACVAAIQSVGQGADPAIPYTFLQIATPHIQQHLPLIPRKQQRDELAGMLKQVMAQAKQVEAAAQAQMEGQQQQQTLTFEQQLALQELQGKLQLQGMKQQQAMQLKQAKAEQDKALSDATTAAQIQRDTALAATQIHLNKAKTEADIAAQKEKAEAAAAKPKPASK